MASDSEKKEDENAPEALVMDKPAYNLEVLAVIRESQQQHGLRHGDYQRYRSYCSRRLRRIRKCVKLMQNHKNRFVKKPITEENVADVRAFYIPLVEAERCWSYSMQLKAEANTEPRKRYHMINKLRKAESYANELYDLCEKVECDARTKLEVQAYKVWMSGTLQFELREWQKSLELLRQAKTIYGKLGEALSGEMALVYKQKVADIEPSIRYCAYNIGDSTATEDLAELRATAHPDSVLDDLIQKAREKQAESLHEVRWRGRIIPVKNDKVRVFLLSLEDIEAELQAQTNDEGKVEVYERVVKDCVDALQWTKDDLKNDTIFKQIQRGQSVESRIPANVFLHTYLQYIKLHNTIQRNLVMVEMYKQGLGEPREGQRSYKPHDIARLHEMNIQNLTEIMDLPGLEDDESLKSDYDLLITDNKAFRCFYLAKSYQLVKQWPECVALAKRAAEYSKEVQSSLPQAESQKHEELLNNVDAMLIMAQASSILDAQDLSADMSRLSLTADNKPLIDRLDEYIPVDPKLDTKKIHLVSLPPDMQPIPCKPKFYDLANGHVTMPDLSHKLTENKKQSGITGLMKSWIGWGGKK